MTLHCIKCISSPSPKRPPKKMQPLVRLPAWNQGCDGVTYELMEPCSVAAVGETITFTCFFGN